MQGYDVAAHPQHRDGKHEVITYFLPNLLFFNMETLPDRFSLNFNIAVIDEVNVDTGGATYYYITDHPALKWLKTDCSYLLNNNSPMEIREFFQKYPVMYKLMTQQRHDYEFYAAYTFIHFRAGSNWNGVGAQGYSEKWNSFFEGLSDLLGIQDR